MFRVDKDCENISTDKAKVFHNLLAKTLCTTKRTRSDTCTPVALIITRVREPYTNTWNKLTHLMKYLRKTRNIPLILGAGGTGIFKW